MTGPHELRHAGLRAAILAAVTVAAGIATATASAASLSIKVVAEHPEQATAVKVTFTGASNDGGNATTLEAIARPSGAIGCQPTFQDDTTAAASFEDVIVDSFSNPTLSPGQPFSQSGTFTPAQTGPYLVCAWLAQTNSTDGVTTIYGPVSTRVSVRGPQVTRLSITAPAHPRPDHAFNVRWNASADQQLTLYGVIARGHGCAANPGLELGSDPAAQNIEGGAALSGGTVSASVLATLATPGRYVLCTWLIGPDPNQVVVHRATRLTVGTPAPRRGRDHIRRR
jgi:hypothetical protein